MKTVYIHLSITLSKKYQNIGKLGVGGGGLCTSVNDRLETLLVDTAQSNQEMSF